VRDGRRGLSGFVLRRRGPCHRSLLPWLSTQCSSRLCPPALTATTILVLPSPPSNRFSPLFCSSWSLGLVGFFPGGRCSAGGSVILVSLVPFKVVGSHGRCWLLLLGITAPHYAAPGVLPAHTLVHCSTARTCLLLPHRRFILLVRARSRTHIAHAQPG